MAAKRFFEAGDDDRQKDALFQSALTNADCRDLSTKSGTGSQPVKTTASTPADDEKFVYYCPDENNVYGGGRYVKPGNGCPSGAKPRRLPRPPAEGKEDDKFVYYCPDENNVYGGGRYVKPGEGCNGPRKAPAAKTKVPLKTSSTKVGNTSTAGVSAEVHAQRQAALQVQRDAVARMPEGPEKEAAKLRLRKLEQLATRQK